MITTVLIRFLYVLAIQKPFSKTGENVYKVEIFSIQFLHAFKFGVVMKISLNWKQEGEQYGMKESVLFFVV